MMRFPFFHMGSGWLFMGLLSIVSILIVGWVIWTLIRRPLSGGVNALPSSSARQILDERYARGEITREEYERIKTDLAAR